MKGPSFATINEQSMFAMRAWFNGRMEASQALDEGSIPFARFFTQG